MPTTVPHRRAQPEWMPTHVFEQSARPETPVNAGQTHRADHQQTAAPTQPSPLPRQQDSPGRKRRKKANRQAAPEDPANHQHQDEASPQQPAGAGRQQQPEGEQAAQQRSVAPQQMHAWIMEAMERHGLEQRRAVATASSNPHDMRLPERLRQAGSKLVGQSFVRSKVCPHEAQPAAAAPLKADFQMKATLDEATESPTACTNPFLHLWNT